MTADRTKRKLGIFRVRCVSCEVKPNAKGKPQVEGLLEPVGYDPCDQALTWSGKHGDLPVALLLQWYGDLSPKSAKYTLASLRALVHPKLRHELTRVSELAAAASNQWPPGSEPKLKSNGPSISVEAFASVVSESFNGEDRIRVEYIYPIDYDPAQPLNGSPLGPRGTPADIARIDLELAPAAIESAHSRERMGTDGELEEDASDVVMVQLPLSVVTPLLGKSGTQRYNRHMRRLAQSVARQVSK